MDRYQRVEKPRPEEPINENEIRVTAQGLIRNYIIYATSLLQDKREEVVLKAMGQAISKAVTIAEIIKKRIPGLHQDICTSSTTITDAYEPIEEGLTPVEMKRQVSLITITLSTAELNKNLPGYQAPPNMEQAKVVNQRELQQDNQVIAPYPDFNQDSYGGRGRGWGQGRGRGHGRVGFQKYQEDGEYYNRGQGGGRGRGWGYQDNGGYYNGGQGRGRGRGRGWGYGGAGYERGRGGRRGGGRGYGRGRTGRGRIVRRGRDGGDQLG